MAALLKAPFFAIISLPSLARRLKLDREYSIIMLTQYIESKKREKKMKKPP